MNQEPIWQPPALPSLHLDAPRRSGSSNNGRQLRLWIRPYPIWMSLMTIPFIGMFVFILVNFYNPTRHIDNLNALRILCIAGVVLPTLVGILLAVGRLEFLVAQKEIAFRRSVLGIGRWHRMPTDSVKHVQLRSVMLTAGVRYEADGDPIPPRYERRMGLLVKGRDEWDFTQSMSQEQAEWLRQHLIHSINHFRSEGQVL